MLKVGFDPIGRGICSIVVRVVTVMVTQLVMVTVNRGIGQLAADDGGVHHAPIIHSGAGTRSRITVITVVTVDTTHPVPAGTLSQVLLMM